MSSKETRAKTKGAAKKAATAMKGLTGIFDTLAKEHGMVSSLMNQVLKGDVDTRIELFPKIRAEILSHAHAEEEEFYPVLLKHAETRDKARESIDEHQSVEDMIDRLDGLDIASPEWMSTFERMRDAVEHHAKEEETEIFPLAKKVMDREEIKRVDERFEKEKERQMSALHAAE